MTAAGAERPGSSLADRLAALSPEKRALVERRLMAKLGAAEPAPAIVPRSRGAPVPLSHAQEVMWLVHQLTPGTHTYNSAGARRLRGHLDVPALRKALNGVLARHEALRTTFEVSDGVPVQIVHEDAELLVPLVDLRDVDPDEREARLRSIMKEEARRPFDLSQPLLMRAQVLQMAEDDHVLFTVANHIVWDGWSKGVLFTELAELYEAAATGREPRLQELPVQFPDYAVWQRTWLSGERLEHQLGYWRRNLAGAPPLLALPSDRPRPAERSENGARQSLWMPAAVLDDLTALGRGRTTTLFMTLLAAFNVLLSRWSGQDDVLIGTPIAGRNRTEIEGLIGYFTNTLVLRTDCSGDPTFAELLQRVRETTLGAFANQDVSFEQVVRELVPQRSLAHSPVFQVMFVLQNAAFDRLTMHGLRTEMLETGLSGTAKFDLGLGMGEHDGRLHGSFEYSTDLFDADTIVRMRGHFGRLLEGIAADPDTKLSRLPMLGDDERRQVVVGWNGAKSEVPRCGLHDLIADRATTAADAVAVVDGARSLTYGELDAWAEGVASELRAAGVSRGAAVGVCLDRSEEMVVALLATLKAGGAFVPLDPCHPAERLAGILSDARPAVVLVADSTRHAVAGWMGGVRTISPTPAAAGAAAGRGDGPACGPGDLAAIMFTSGSTGRPKGVLLEHRGFVNHALDAVGRYGLAPGDRVLQFCSLGSDIALEEIFATLVAGATLVLRTDDMPLAGPELVSWLAERRITVLDLPTAYWHEWVSDLVRNRQALPPSLRLVIVGGEKASASTYDRWRRLAGEAVRWVNTYGPTETSIVATAHEPDPSWVPAEGEEVPIGRPLTNVTAFVVDRSLSPTPIGVIGELCLGGRGVARGYLGDPTLTGDRFIPDPFSSEQDARLYRTGDRARWRVDGELEFFGRSDTQVKIRGFRVDPGEVSSVLTAHPEVAEAAAVPWEDDERGTRLAAYVVPLSAPAADFADDLRRWAGERLPAHLVPDAVMVLASFPVTANGKVDVDRLPPPKRRGGGGAPSTDVERALVEIWSEVLGIDDLGIDDGFFDLGGHSLLAIRMFAQVEDRFGIRLPLATLLRAQTVAELAGIVDHSRPAPSWTPLVALQQGGDRPPLFCVHEASGEVLPYRELAVGLGSAQTVYGLQSVGLDGVSTPLATVEEMAVRYLSEVRAVRPSGPYLFLGVCVGGLIAYEMARQLQHAGEHVGLVCLVDATPPEPRVDAARGRFGRQASDRAVRPALAWASRRRLVGHDGDRPAGDMQAANLGAARRYVPAGYAGPLDLVSSRSPADRQSLAAAWDALTTGGVRVHATAPNVAYQRRLHEPHVGMLAGVVRELLDRARADTGP